MNFSVTRIIAYVCISLFCLALTGSVAAAGSGVDLKRDFIRSTGKTTCGYIGTKWLPGKLKKNGLFFSHKARIKSVKKRFRKAKNSSTRTKLSKALAKWKRKQKREQKMCRPLTAPGRSLLADDDWRAITNSREILAGLEFSGASAVLTIVNNSADTVGAPSLVTYSLTTGEAQTITPDSAEQISSGSFSSFNVTFPGDAPPSGAALISLLLGDKQAALFAAAETYAKLSPAFTTPLVSSQLAYLFDTTPNPGTWNFEMQLGTDYMSGAKCPSGPGSTTSSGEATLYVSNDELSAMLLIDGDLVSFSRSSTSNDFHSPQYTFPVETDEGTAYGFNDWELTPTSQTEITGVLNWDNNQQCSAEYPIELDFVSLGNPTIFALCEGPWAMNLTSLVCNPMNGAVPPTIISPPALPNFPFLTGDLDVAYAADVPLSLNYSSLSSFMSLPNIGGTNMYGNPYANMVFGTVLDSSTAPLMISGAFQLTATSTTSIFGLVTINGYGPNPCSGVSTFTMTYVGPSC